MYIERYKNDLEIEPDPPIGHMSSLSIIFRIN